MKRAFARAIPAVLPSTYLVAVDLQQRNNAAMNLIMACKACTVQGEPTNADVSLAVSIARKWPPRTAVLYAPAPLSCTASSITPLARSAETKLSVICCRRRGFHDYTPSLFYQGDLDLYVRAVRLLHLPTIPYMPPISMLKVHSARIENLLWAAYCTNCL